MPMSTWPSMMFSSCSKIFTRVVLDLAESLNDDQLHWKPKGYSTSIGFHLWHLARESDYLKAVILERYPAAWR